MQKKLYFFCLILTMMCSVTLTYAQKGKSEVSVAYGYYSIYSLVNHDRVAGKPLSASSGTGMINYKYYLTNKTTIGGVIGYENINTWGSFLIFAPEMTFTYYDNKDDRIRVKMYGSISAGLAVFEDYQHYNNMYAMHQDETGARLTAHGSPFGIRIGRRFAGFAELGLGYKGIFNGGFSYRFRTKRRMHIEN